MERIEREKRVIELMVSVYCRRHHHVDGGGLCGDCSRLLDYARRRLDSCPKGNAKTTCRKCTIHCYAPDKRQAIREVMRYVGPRMLFIHPLVAVRHLLSEMR